MAATVVAGAKVTGKGEAGGQMPFSTGYAWFTVGVMSFTYMLSLLDRTILALLIESIQADLKISDTQFGLLQGLTFAIFFLLAGLPIGWLVDRVSRVRIVMVGLAVWSVMTLLSGFANRFLHLFLARMGVAAGEAALNPAVYSLFADIFPKERLGRALAFFLIGSMVGTGLAYAFGGALVAFFGQRPSMPVPLLGELRVWQLAFVAAGAPGLLLALLMLFMKEPPRSGIAHTALPASNRQVISFFRHNAMLLFLHFSGFALMTMQSYSFFTWGPALLFRTHGLSPGEVGMAMGVATGIFGTAGFFSGGLLADVFLRKGLNDAHMRVGMLAMFASFPFALVVCVSRDPTLAAAMLSPLMFFLMMPTAAAVAGLQLVVPARLRGRVSAIFMVITNLAGLGLGPLLAALLNDYVFESGAAIGLSLAIVTGVIVPLSALAFGVARHPLGAAISARATEEMSEAAR